MNKRRYPYPIPGSVKQTVYHAVRFTERMVRGVAGSNPRLDPASLRQIRNFLLPQFQVSLGCAVHATPIVEALQQAVPNARVVGVMSGLALEVFGCHPGLERVETVSNPSGNLLKASRQIRTVIADFHGEPYCVVFTGGDENVRASVALAAILSGNGVRAGINVAPALLHLPVGHDRSVSAIGRNLRLVELLGHPAPAALEPRVCFREADLDHARALIAGSGSDPLALLITRTSGGQLTRWPDDRFVAVGEYLIRRGFRIILSGTKADVGELEVLARRMGQSTTSVAGQTTIPQLAALCAVADVAVALDTGGMHVARAQGLPLAIIAPAWQDSVEWMPLGKPWVRILKGPWMSPPPPPGYAIEEVGVDEVTESVDDLLHRYPASLAAREERISRSLAGAASRPISVALS